MAPSEGESSEANLRIMEGSDAPKLPYDSISTIFERIGDFYLEISAIVVVCRGFLVLRRHRGGRQEAKTPTRRFRDIKSREDGRGRGRRRSAWWVGE